MRNQILHGILITKLYYNKIKYRFNVSLMYKYNTIFMSVCDIKFLPQGYKFIIVNSIT